MVYIDVAETWSRYMTLQDIIEMVEDGSIAIERTLRL